MNRWIDGKTCTVTVHTLTHTHKLLIIFRAYHSNTYTVVTTGLLFPCLASYKKKKVSDTLKLYAHRGMKKSKSYLAV